MSDKEHWLNSAEVRERYRISNATLYRWERQGEFGFPAPMIINRRKLYPESKLREWERTQASASVRRAAA